MEERKKGKRESAGEEPVPTVVKVFGIEYHLNASEDPAYVRRVAEYVDRKMREISSGSHVLDQSKLAILTAMDIADELLMLRRKRYAIIGRTGTVAEKLARVVPQESGQDRQAATARKEE